MGIIKDRFRELSDYKNMYVKENQVSKNLIERYKDKTKTNQEYLDFKKSIVYMLEKVFGEGKSKMLVKPNRDSTQLFSMLVEDKEFTRIYNCKVVNKSLEISPVSF